MFAHTHTHTHTTNLEHVLRGEIAGIVLAKRLHPVHRLRMSLPRLIKKGGSVHSSVWNGGEGVPETHRGQSYAPLLGSFAIIGVVCKQQVHCLQRGCNY